MKFIHSSMVNGITKTSKTLKPGSRENHRRACGLNISGASKDNIAYARQANCDKHH